MVSSLQIGSLLESREGYDLGLFELLQLYRSSSYSF